MNPRTSSAHSFPNHVGSPVVRARWAIVLALALTSAFGLRATPVRFFATTSAKDTAGIYRCEVDSVTGAFSEPIRAAELADANFLAFSADGTRLYAAGGISGVSAYQVKENGELVFLNRQPTNGRAIHVWLEPKGPVLLSANFDEGTVVSFPIMPDGSIGERKSIITFTGSGPRLPRQAHSRPHATYTDAAGTTVFVCDLGADKVWSLTLDLKSAELKFAAGMGFSVAPGGGPRHAALFRDEFLFVNTEMSPGVTVFKRSSGGALTAVATRPTLPDGVEAQGTTTAENFLHPNGKVLYVSNRGYNSITRFAVGDDGSLTWTDNLPLPIRAPRTFALTRDAKLLVAAGEGDGGVVSARVASDGKLTLTGERTLIRGVNCVMFAR